MTNLTGLIKRHSKAKIRRRILRILHNILYKPSSCLGSEASVIINIKQWLRVGRQRFDPRKGQEICLYSVQTGSGAHPASYPWGVKRPGRDADHSPPSSAEVKNGGAIPELHLIN
jgi:hypothetical protein